jgi:hypothetical protein
VVNKGHVQFPDTAAALLTNQRWTDADRHSLLKIGNYCSLPSRPGLDCTAAQYSNVTDCERLRETSIGR